MSFKYQTYSQTTMGSRIRCKSDAATFYGVDSVLLRAATRQMLIDQGQPRYPTVSMSASLFVLQRLTKMYYKPSLLTFRYSRSTLRVNVLAKVKTLRDAPAGCGNINTVLKALRVVLYVQCRC